MKGSEVDSSRLSPQRKALLLNLEPDVYGTFAEIGAGQEVARHFFQAGGASGTLAKSISAYDMKFSDTIYGKANRYVSKERLSQMLRHEYRLLIERLSRQRGKHTTFFAYANTVAAASHTYNKECHGWMGVRFQIEPQGPPHDIIAHVRLLDRQALAQQASLGTFGVNLIWAAIVYHYDMDTFLKSLSEGLGGSRVEVDQLQLFGEHFKAFNNKEIALQLIEHQLTHSAIFDPKGQIQLPSEAFYKKSLLVERGHFHPLHYAQTDMMENALEQFKKKESITEDRVLPLFEITSRNIFLSSHQAEMDIALTLQKVETINAEGYAVLVSDYPEHYRLSAYFRQYTQEPIVLATSAENLVTIFDRRYYTHLEGGILEALGRMFKANIQLYIYPSFPTQPSSGESFLADVPQDPGAKILGAENLKVEDELKHLYRHLLDNRFIRPITNYRTEHLGINSKVLLRTIEQGHAEWKKEVPAKAAALIEKKQLFKNCP